MFVGHCETVAALKKLETPFFKWLFTAEFQLALRRFDWPEKCLLLKVLLLECYNVVMEPDWT